VVACCGDGVSYAGLLAVSKAERAAMNDDLALVGFKSCGCAVAVDLDRSNSSAIEYVRRGYEIRTMPAADAIALLKASNCMHGWMRVPKKGQQ